MKVEERREIVLQHRLCFNCLKSHHLAKNCSSEFRCKQDNCGKPHHTLLHVSASSGDFKLPQANASGSTGGTGDKTVTSTLQSIKGARLKFVPVEITSSQSGKKIKTYAFIDDGSNATLCTTKLMQRLNVQDDEESLQISTIFGPRSQKAFKLDLLIQGINETKQFFMKDVYALPSLPDVSDNIVKHEDITDLSHLEGIEFPILTNQDVDVLIGMDNVQCLLVDNVKVGKVGQPLGQHTALSWAVISKDKNFVGSSSNNFIHVNYKGLNQDLKGFFSCDLCDTEVEDVLGPSIEDRRAMNVMAQHTKTNNGKFVIGLP